jgi:phospholipid/cholesterol/gamma-HCH transport system permease protein
MVSPSPSGSAQVIVTTTGTRLSIEGDWVLSHYSELATLVKTLSPQINLQTDIDISKLGAFDTAGADLLYDLLGKENLGAILKEGDKYFPPERLALFKTVYDTILNDAATELPAEQKPNSLTHFVEGVGEGMATFADHSIELITFIGATLQHGYQSVINPKSWRTTSLIANIEKTGFDAVPIIALLNFLVGAVVAFLGARVLSDFGASLYTVDLVTFSFLREFGVLLTAIIVAGRTASAFTAQIGSMKANEEIDAIRVLGLEPFELLVLPRVFALLIALPILTFIAMMAGILGGMMVCAISLDISPTLFLSIFNNDVALKHFFIGMAKAPIFAFLVAVIGCQQGLKVTGSAESVGEHTTSAVVQSIFVVIVIDAIAAMFCMEMKW